MSVRGLFLFPVKSYPPGTLVQYLVEAGKEGDGCNGRCQNITDRLGEKDAEALIYREAGQDKNQRDKQDDLPQTGQQARSRLTFAWPRAIKLCWQAV